MRHKLRAVLILFLLQSAAFLGYAQRQSKSPDRITTLLDTLIEHYYSDTADHILAKLKKDPAFRYSNYGKDTDHFLSIKELPETEIADSVDILFSNWSILEKRKSRSALLTFYFQSEKLAKKKFKELDKVLSKACERRTQESDTNGKKKEYNDVLFIKDRSIFPSPHIRLSVVNSPELTRAWCVDIFFPSAKEVRH